jgi:hypothetical protein
MQRACGMNARHVGWTCALLAIASARVAAADDASTPATHVEPRAALVLGDWYGWQLFIADVASDVTILASSAVNDTGGASTGLAVLGGLSGVVGGPIVHGVHHRSAGLIVGSLGLRIGLSVFGMAIGAAQGTCPPPTCAGGEFCFNFNITPCVPQTALVGAAVGLVIAQFIDDTLLSTEPAHALLPRATAVAPTLRIEPSFGTLSDSERRTVPTFGVTLAF